MEESVSDIDVVIFLKLSILAGGGGVFTNPSFNMKFYPPVGWTYPSDTAITDMSYLPGQSMTQAQAQNLANGALTAAFLEGLNAIGYPTTGVTVTPTYTPPLVNDCGKTSTRQTAAGTQFGIVENGAVTKLAALQGTGATQIQYTDCISRAYIPSGNTAISLVYTPFVQQASVKIDGIVLSEYQANMVAAKVAQVLTLGSSAQFTEEITIG